MITVSNITKVFGKKKAVDAISFTIKKGEIVGFLGPNGAGKTTTMRLLVGFLSPTTGTILIDELSPVRDRTFVLQKVGYLPENNPLYPEMKVSEYLQFICDTKGADSIEESCRAVNIEDILDQKIEELSRGYRQRVGLAAALIGNPEALILDEPTSGLDPIEQEKIRSLIKNLSKKTTVIFSTHILSEVEEIADRLIIIKKGNIVYDGQNQKKGINELFKKVMQ
jgi:ABC-2 type transport system ATP-binding protein